MLKTLKQIGLKEKEIKVYLIVLEKGSLSAQAIAAEAGIKRTTVYLVLERLKKIGLAGEIIDKNKKSF
jgi:sugar-specific transcriptional regulator TrmB